MGYAVYLVPAIIVAATTLFIVLKKRQKDITGTFEYPPPTPATVRVAELYIYPVKSCKGIQVQQANLSPYGFEYDRNWMVVDKANRFVSQRQVPAMAFITPAILDGELLLSAPNMQPLKIPLAYDHTKPEATVSVWSSTCSAIDEGPEASAWLSSFLGTEVKLVRMTPNFTRGASEKYWTDEFPGSKLVSFADGFPFLLISRESLVGLNERVSGEQLQMNRFRPNIVTFGSEPFEEDEWKSVQIGHTIFHPIKRCARCKITTIDQERGVVAGEEPLATLRTFRKQDDSVFFGQNLVHESNDGEVCVGDVVLVLEKWKDGKCPPFPKADKNKK